MGAGGHGDVDGHGDQVLTVVNHSNNNCTDANATVPRTQASKGVGPVNLTEFDGVASSFTCY